MCSHRHRFRYCTAMLVAVFWVGALLVDPAGAATQVYFSPNDDGQPAVGPPLIPTGGVQSVYLYIDGGASASAVDTACASGNGSEVCGYTLTLTGLSGLTLNGFNADPGANLIHDLDPLEFRVNGLDTQAPTPGPKRIGELLVNAVETGSLELTQGEVVGADLSSEALAAGEIVAVPEPSLLVQIASGAVLLACIGRNRARK